MGGEQKLTNLLGEHDYQDLRFDQNVLFLPKTKIQIAAYEGEICSLMYCKPCVTQLNEKPTEASTYFETGRREIANIRVCQLHSGRGKQMKALEGIKENCHNLTAKLIISLQKPCSLPPNKNKPFVLSNSQTLNIFKFSKLYLYIKRPSK